LFLVGQFLNIFYSETALFDQAVSEEKIFRNQPTRNKKLPMATMFVNGLGQNE
jgi:hypothetical protein